jgi:hypothetical protein
MTGFKKGKMKKFSLRLFVLGCTLLGSRVNFIWAESPFKPKSLIGIEEFILPWDGPGAAIFNPALITEIERVNFRVGSFATVSSKNRQNHIQIAGRAAQFYGGFAIYNQGSMMDGSRAVYLEEKLTPMLGFKSKFFLGTPLTLGLGVAMPFQFYNAFDAIKSTQTSLDLGAYLTLQPIQNLGQLHTGVALQNLFSSGVEFPDGHGKIYPYPWNLDVSFFWRDIFEMIDLFALFHAFEDEGINDYLEKKRSIGPSFFKIWYKAYGLEFRPLKFVGLKIERTYNEYWTFGVTAKTLQTFAIPIQGEFCFSHDRWLTPQDEGRGFIYSGSLGIGF